MLTMEQAAAGQYDYKAREAFRRPLGQTVLNAFVGPTGVGKNFLMEQSGLPVVGTVTTREKRDSDGPGYRYESVDNMLQKIEDGEMIQYGAYPPNIYGSELQDYTLDTPNAADIYYNAVYGLENKGFKSVRSVSVLTTQAQWMSQLSERFEGMEARKVIARLDEARQSLRWIRAQHLGVRATNHLVLLNQTDNVRENIEKIQAFAHNEPIEPLDDVTVDSYITGMERAVQTMYGRLGTRLP